MRDYIKLLKNKNIALLFWGQWVSNIGTSINSLGLLWFIANYNSKISDIGIMMLTMFLPSVIIGPFAGAYTDRMDKKTIVIVTDLIRGMLSLGIIFTNALYQVYLIVFLSSILDVFFSPAIRSLYPRIAKKEELMTLNSMGGAAFRLSQLIGPAFGGLLIGLFGVKILFVINGISFVISGISECFLKLERDLPNKSDESSLIKDLKEAAKYIGDRKLIVFVIGFFAVLSLTGGGWRILYTALIKFELGFDSEIMGFCMSAMAIGAVLGAIYLKKINEKISELDLMLLGSLLYSVSYLFMGISGSVFSLILVFGSTGFFSSFLNISYGVYLQKNVDSEMMGRVFSLDIAIGNIFIIISIIATTWLGSMFSASLLLVIYAVTAVLLSLISIVYKNKTLQAIYQISESE